MGPMGIVEVRRDGKTVQTFEESGPESRLRAAHWLQTHQPMSTDWAIKFEGYSIWELGPDGQWTDISGDYVSKV